MQPFLSHLAASADPTAELRIVHGKGRFGRQVAGGAEASAWQLGFSHVSTGPAAAMLSDELPEDWVLITAGTFEEDTETVTRARCLAHPPRVTCTIAAGVREFREAVESPDGTFGIAQWSPESGQPALLASEREFLDAYHAMAGELPSYPAAQAAATAVLAVHCARQAGRTDRELLMASRCSPRHQYPVRRLQDRSSHRRAGESPDRTDPLGRRGADRHPDSS
jgi:hypothetical protein